MYIEGCQAELCLRALDGYGYGYILGPSPVPPIYPLTESIVGKVTGLLFSLESYLRSEYFIS